MGCEKSREITRKQEKWRDANKAKMSQLAIAWQQKNRDRVNRRARERYALNLELSRAKLKAKRIKMGEKYQAMIKRNRTKMRATTEGMLYHRMSQSIRAALKGAKLRCKWETLLGYSLAHLRTHLESQFTDGMTWERFFGGEIHIDHIVPRVQFKFDSPNDEAFKSCWALSNLRLFGAAQILSQELDFVGNAPRKRCGVTENQFRSCCGKANYLR